MTLKEHVKQWIDEMAEDYDGDRAGVLEDLLQHGCQSGMVGHLIYYTDTDKFFHAHREEIHQLAIELEEETGEKIEDILNGFIKRSYTEYLKPEEDIAVQQNNINILAWFGFEETARIIAEEEGYNI